jgi:hypothetical protein
MEKRAVWGILSHIGSVVLLATVAVLTFQSYRLTNARVEIASDATTVAGIGHGLFSVAAWEEKLRPVVRKRLENLTLTPNETAALEAAIGRYLNTFIDEAERHLRNDTSTFKGQITKWGVDLFFDDAALRRRVPAISEKIVARMTDARSRVLLADLVESQWNMTSSRQGPSEKMRQKHIQAILDRHGGNSKTAFLNDAKAASTRLDQHARRYAAIVAGLTLLFALAMLLTLRSRHRRACRVLFSYAAVLACIVLLGGLATPMLEIDARITNLQFQILGERLDFDDQVLVYRSKSILEVVALLFRSAAMDARLVGVLVLAFSVLMPVSKLVASSIYLARSEQPPRSRLLRWLALASGKWSMADVLVVAIMMAFIGFDGILQSNMDRLAAKTPPSVEMIATQKTALLPGFGLFLTFVLLSLFLSTVLGHIVSRARAKTAPD